MHCHLSVAGRLFDRWRPLAPLWRAAYLNDERAIQSWLTWRGNNPLASQPGYLPSVLGNLRRLGYKDADFGFLEHLEEEFWSHLELIERGGERALGHLHQQGIPTLRLKGAAMVKSYYRESGSRWMADFDILVPRHDAARALDALASQGWVSDHDLPLSQMLTHHSQGHRHPDHPGYRIDLHWHALSECRWPGSDEAVWSRSRDGLLDPADHLVVLCCNAARDNSRSPWLLDASAILERTGEQLDWSVVISESRARRVEIPVAAALAFLGSELGLPVSRALDEAPSAWCDGVYFWSQMHASPLAMLAETWCDFLRTDRPGWRWWRILDFLQERWGVSGPLPLGAELLRRARRRLVRNRPADFPSKAIQSVASG
ncbi:MAG: hypothetical protein AMXMBFR33_16720 [Candidatus Xenobia bacterium]